MPRPHRRGSCPSESEPILHSGVLFKRGYGTTPIIGRKSWKPRHFVLTSTRLQYYTFENGKLRDEIDLRKCHADSLEIMPSDARKTGRSKSSIWRLALNVPQGRRVLMAAPTEREMNAWIKHIGGVLHELHASKPPPSAPLSTSKVDNQRADEQEEKKEDDDDEELLEQLTSRHSNGLDGLVAASWKNSTTDFQNFVAQPRRSMIFRRHSFEGKPIVPGVYRNSTGQIDDRELAKELEELRREYVSFHSDGAAEDDMTEEEEDALLRALRAFSAVHSERNDFDPAEEHKEKDNQHEAEETVASTAPAKPIFHFKKPSTPPTSPRDNNEEPVRRGTEDARWFSHFAGKFHRKDKRGLGHIIDNDRVVASACNPAGDVAERTRTHRGHDDDLPAHMKEDPATSKPRRYSTGSMMLASERQALNPERDSEAEREEALIQELLAGLVYNQYDEKSLSAAGLDSNEGALDDNDQRPSSGSSDRSHTTHSSAQQTPTASSGSPGSAERISLACSDMIELLPASAPLIPTTRERAYSRGDEKDLNGDRWFTRLKTKWRTRHDDEKSMNSKAKPHEDEGEAAVPALGGDTLDAAAVVGTTKEARPPREGDDSVEAEVASVLSDMVANVGLLDYTMMTPRASAVFLTSPNSTTARLQPQLPTRPVRPRATTTNSRGDQESHQKKRGFFRRWSEKLRSNRETRSRRHSTGDTIPDSVIPQQQTASVHATEPKEPVAACEEVDPVEPTEFTSDDLEEARHFGVKLRRNTKDTQGLVELHEMANASQAVVESTEPTDGDESEEEIVVVVVRRRHSIDWSVSMPSQKRVTFHVFVDVGDNEAHDENTIPTTKTTDVRRVLPMQHQLPSVCAV